MIGASLACGLANKNIGVAVIEAVSPSVDDQPSYDERGLSLAPSSQRILNKLGVWSEIEPNANPIKQVHVSDRGHFGFVRMQAEMMKLDALGHIVVARELGRALLSRISAADNIDMLCPARVGTVEMGRDGVKVDITDEESERQLNGKLLVVADGTHSQIRSQLAIQSRIKDYGQTAIVANVTPERHHQNTAYERFTETGTFALLPLSEGRCVSFYTVKTEEAEALLSLDDAAFLERAEKRFGKRLGRFTKAGKRKSYPLLLVEPSEQIRERLVLLGNAAHAIHPNGAQGFNLGLRDVAGLLDKLLPAIEDGMDPGSAYILETYLESRSADQRRVMQFSDGLTWIFYDNNPGKIMARDIGMLVTDLVPGLKKSMIRKMMGVWGAQPDFVRGSAL